MNSDRRYNAGYSAAAGRGGVQQRPHYQRGGAHASSGGGIHNKFRTQKMNYQNRQNSDERAPSYRGRGGYNQTFGVHHENTGYQYPAHTEGGYVHRGGRGVRGGRGGFLGQYQERAHHYQQSAYEEAEEYHRYEENVTDSIQHRVIRRGAAGRGGRGTFHQGRADFGEGQGHAKYIDREDPEEEDYQVHSYGPRTIEQRVIPARRQQYTNNPMPFIDSRSRGGKFKLKTERRPNFRSRYEDYDYDYGKDKQQYPAEYQEPSTNWGKQPHNDGGYQEKQSWPHKQGQINSSRPVIPAEVTAQQKGIQPQRNPTGNPFQRFVKVPANMEALKKLQIKQNLRKVGEPPRSFGQKLKDANNSSTYIIDNNWSNRTLICDRFQKIQYAQRALHPLTITLLNEKRGIFTPQSRPGPRPSGDHLNTSQTQIAQNTSTQQHKTNYTSVFKPNARKQGYLQQQKVGGKTLNLKSAGIKKNATTLRIQKKKLKN